MNSQVQDSQCLLALNHFPFQAFANVTAKKKSIINHICLCFVKLVPWGFKFLKLLSFPRQCLFLLPFDAFPSLLIIPMVVGRADGYVPPPQSPQTLCLFYNMFLYNGILVLLIRLINKSLLRLKHRLRIKHMHPVSQEDS